MTTLRILRYSSSSLMGKKRLRIGRTPIRYMARGMSYRPRSYLVSNPETIRHLAKKWETEYIPPHTKRRLLPGYSNTEISTIEHLILLDLLGAPNPLIRSSFADTAWLFDSMIDAESRLSQQGAFNTSGSPASLSTQSFFLNRSRVTFNFGGIEDDHLPFLRLGVSVLHVIPNPFPKVWHKITVCVLHFLLLCNF